MSEELIEDLATEAQVRCFTALMHRLAEKRGEEYKEVRKQMKERFGYSNLSKVERETISDWIDQLERELDEQVNETMNNEEEKENAGEPVEGEPEVNEPVNDADISFYVDLLGQIYDAVADDVRIPADDRVSAVKWVFEAVSRDRRSRLIANLRRR